MALGALAVNYIIEPTGGHLCRAVRKAAWTPEIILWRMRHAFLTILGCMAR
jgi:hypothetical protein